LFEISLAEINSEFHETLSGLAVLVGVHVDGGQFCSLHALKTNLKILVNLVVCGLGAVLD
jgi:hypothetical protein